jgi:transcriptional regulator with XRE-family HTH domain
MYLDMKTYESLIPKALKKARERAGLSVEEAAQRTGISIPAIGNYEVGKNLPLTRIFHRIRVFFCRQMA